VGVAKTLLNDDIRAGDNFTVVLDDVKDTGNIGTIIRTCHAFGISDIFSTSEELDIYQRKVIDASRGSAFATRLRCFQNPGEAVSYLKAHDYQVVATSPRGDSLQSLLQLKPQPVALIVGNESVGIHADIEKQADFLVQIPMSSEMESLNVGVATGISIYEIKLKQVLAMIEQQIKSSLGRELNVAGMMVQRALDVELRQVSELSSRQVVFMMVLRCDRKMTVEHMCCQFGILEKNVSDFLEPLTHSGLVALEGDTLTLSVAGEEVLGKLWRWWKRWMKRSCRTFLLKKLEHSSAICSRSKKRVAN
jgi:TrmH family RNA methyltransferase